MAYVEKGTCDVCDRGLAERAFSRTVTDRRLGEYQRVIVLCNRCASDEHDGLMGAGFAEELFW